MNRTALCLLVLSIIPVLAASGCTTTTTPTVSGVVIQEFSPGFSEVQPGEPITFYLKFKNEGSVDATNVFAELVGLDEDWAASSAGGGNVIEGGELLPREAGCRYTSTGNHLTLKAPDLTYGTEGETGSCTWMYKTPQIPPGTNTNYDITARVFYNYHTYVVKSFTVAPISELERYSQQGRTIPASTVSSTSSPITITVKSMDPIRFWEGKVSFPIAITVSNKGGGMVCLKDENGCKKTDGGASNWNKLKLKINKPEGVSLSPECSDYVSGKPLEVWPNNDNTITCDLTVSGLTGSSDGSTGVVGYQEKLIGITAEYGYFIDKEASVKIS
jgi:hypothetical protein